MYSPEMVARREERFFRDIPELRKDFPKGLPWYSVDDTKAIVEDLVARTPNGLEQPEKLRPEESRFIKATKYRNWLDFTYWAERFAKIDEEGHGIRPLFP